MKGVVLFRLLLKQAGTLSLGVGRRSSSANINKNLFEKYKLCFRFTRISTREQDVHTPVLSMIE